MPTGCATSTKSATSMRSRKSVKELVHFDFHNLKTEFLPQRNDMIFCRNVMIYFDEAEQKRLIEKFYRCLNPEGYLFIGHAESLFGLSDKFRMIHENNGTAYQRIEAARVSFFSEERAPSSRNSSLRARRNSCRRSTKKACSWSSVRRRGGRAQRAPHRAHLEGRLSRVWLQGTQRTCASNWKTRSRPSSRRLRKASGRAGAGSRRHFRSDVERVPRNKAAPNASVLQSQIKQLVQQPTAGVTQQKPLHVEFCVVGIRADGHCRRGGTRRNGLQRRARHRRELHHARGRGGDGRAKRSLNWDACSRCTRKKVSAGRPDRDRSRPSKQPQS